MRFLVITNMYPPHHLGGYELSCQDTVEYFLARNHETAVLTSNIRMPGVADEDPSDHAIWRDLHTYWNDHRIVSPAILERLAIERHNHRVLWERIRSFRPDVISVWNMGAVGLGLLKSVDRSAIPVVFVLGDDWPRYAPHLDAWSRLFRGRFGRLASPILTRGLGAPTGNSDYGGLGPLLFNSQAMRTKVVEDSKWKPTRTAIVYPGIPTSLFSPEGESSQVERRTWRWRLLYVGRIDERKGVDTVVRALPQLSSAHLTILGRGDETYLRRIMAMADHLGVSGRVSYGAVDRAALPDSYRSADVLIFPSTYAEPFGLVPLEAMACDTPVVATGRGGSAEYLRDGLNCLIFEAGNPDSLTHTVSELSTDPALRDRLLRGGRRTARLFTAEQYSAVLLSWHESAGRRFVDGCPDDLATLPELLEQEGSFPSPDGQLSDE